MRKQNGVRSTLLIALTIALAPVLLPHTVQAVNLSKTAKAGTYSVTLKVLPAESFSGPKAEMVRESGAEPYTLKGPEHPNHHLVAFVSEDEKPVEDANVTIRYRELTPTRGAWMTLPVVRMHVAGKGVETTHYGNNVKLGPGSYQARVTVNGKSTVTFRFTV